MAGITGIPHVIPHRIHINGNDAGEIQARIRAASGQTAVVLAVQNSAGTNLFTVDNDGDVSIIGNLDAVVNEALTGNITLTGNLTVDGNTTIGNAAGDTFTINATPTFLTAISLTTAISSTSNATFSGFVSATNFTLPRRGVAPATMGNTGRVYTLEGDSGTTELFYLDAAGNSVQITDSGVVSMGSVSGMLTFSSGEAVTAASYQIGRDADGTNQIHLNVPTGASFEFSVNDTAELVLNATNLQPGTNDGLALGVSGTAFADLFLASTAVINFAAGDVTITHSANTLAFAGATSGYSFDDDLHVLDDMYISFGNVLGTPDAEIGWNTSQTVDALFIALSTAQNTLIIAEIGDIAFDFTHGAQTNPTLFIHSASASTTEWISFAHNATNGIITTGAGAISFVPSGVGVSSILLTNSAGARTAAHTAVTFDGTVGAAAGGTLFDINVSQTGASAIAIFDIDVSALYTGEIFSTVIGAVAYASDILNFDLGATSTTGQLMVLAGGAAARTTHLIELNDAGTSTGIGLDINKTGGSYSTGIGYIDLVRSGNFTGVDTETGIDFRIAPSFTLTEPGAGTFTLYGMSIDLSGIAVTAGAGTTLLSCLYLNANADADVGTNLALFVDQGTTRLDGTLQLGLAGTVTGVMNFQGSTSGVVTIQPAAAAGTYTLTLPADDGTADQVLTTNGTGTLTWTTPAAGSSIPVIIASCLWDVSARLTQDSGGGGSNALGSAGLTITTSATGTSYAVSDLRISSTGAVAFTLNPSCAFRLRVSTAPTTGSSYFGVIATGVNGSGHTYTFNQFGFKIIYASSTATTSMTNGNGTTETASTIAGLTITDQNSFYGDLTTNTNYRGYANTTLVATSTTNLPSTANGANGTLLSCSVSNNATATNFVVMVGFGTYTQDGTT